MYLIRQLLNLKRRDTSQRAPASSQSEPLSSKKQQNENLKTQLSQTESLSARASLWNQIIRSRDEAQDGSDGAHSEIESRSLLDTRGETNEPKYNLGVYIHENQSLSGPSYSNVHSDISESEFTKKPDNLAQRETVSSFISELRAHGALSSSRSESDFLAFSSGLISGGSDLSNADLSNSDVSGSVSSNSNSSSSELSNSGLTSSDLSSSDSSSSDSSSSDLSNADLSNSDSSGSDSSSSDSFNSDLSNLEVRCAGNYAGKCTNEASSDNTNDASEADEDNVGGYVSDDQNSGVNFSEYERRGGKTLAKVSDEIHLEEDKSEEDTVSSQSSTEDSDLEDSRYRTSPGKRSGIEIIDVNDSKDEEYDGSSSSTDPHYGLSHHGYSFIDLTDCSTELYAEQIFSSDEEPKEEDARYTKHHCSDFGSRRPTSSGKNKQRNVGMSKQNIKCTGETDLLSELVEEGRRHKRFRWGYDDPDTTDRAHPRWKRLRPSGNHRHF